MSRQGLLQIAMRGRQRYAHWTVLPKNAAIKRTVEINGDRLPRRQDCGRQPATGEPAGEFQTGTIAKARSADRLRAGIEPPRTKFRCERLQVDIKRARDCGAANGLAIGRGEGPDRNNDRIRRGPAQCAESTDEPGAQFAGDHFERIAVEPYQLDVRITLLLERETVVVATERPLERKAVPGSVGSRRTADRFETVIAVNTNANRRSTVPCDPGGEVRTIRHAEQRLLQLGSFECPTTPIAPQWMSRLRQPQQ